MDQNILALDIGTKNIGIAIYNAGGIPAPLQTISNDQNFLSKLSQLIDEHKINRLVIGNPRDLNGNETNQTVFTKKMSQDIKKSLAIELTMIDEALTSVKAREELDKRGKIYLKTDIDKLAACYILEDYLKSL